MIPFLKFPLEHLFFPPPRFRQASRLRVGARFQGTQAAAPWPRQRGWGAKARDLRVDQPDFLQNMGGQQNCERVFVRKMPYQIVFF